MPEAITHQITTRYKLAKGETGITTMSTRQLSPGRALEWILNDLQDLCEEGVSVTHENDGKTAVIRIDWDKMPECIRNPRIPAPRRR